MADNDIQEMKEWLLANAQQSRHPEYGDRILAALEELNMLRKETSVLKILLRLTDPEEEVKHE